MDPEQLWLPPALAGVPTTGSAAPHPLCPGRGRVPCKHHFTESLRHSQEVGLDITPSLQSRKPRPAKLFLSCGQSVSGAGVRIHFRTHDFNS